MKNTAKQTTTAPGPFVLHRQIGSTLYKIGIYFNPAASETLEDKILRLLRNELQSAPENAKMESLQAGWLPRMHGRAVKCEAFYDQTERKVV